MRECMIAGKRIYIVERHNDALRVWAELRRELTSPPLLVTLDHHTDTAVAFRDHACQETGGDPETATEVAASHVCRIDYREPSSVDWAVSRLDHDEQIDAAIRSGILDVAFVIAREGGSATLPREVAEFYDKYPLPMPMLCGLSPPEGPFTYTVPPTRVFLLRRCYPGCTKRTHDDDCTRPLRDCAVESEHLADLLGPLPAMCEAVGFSGLSERTYILDIDLDYFQTGKSVCPSDPTTFYGLIRGAHAITIAMEPECAKELRLEGEQIDSESLLAALKAHIRAALGASS